MRFRDLEKKGRWLPEENPSSLTKWYLSVRDIPLDMLDVGDVCRALRQNLFVSEVLPIAVALLEDDVLAGELYDGELIVALAGLNAGYWQENKNLAHKAVNALGEAGKLSKDVELLRDVSALVDFLVAL